MIYAKFKENLLKGAQFTLLTDTVKVALLTQAYVYNDTHEFFSDVSASQPVATGYTAGGLALSNKTIVSSSGIVTFDADDAVWAITGQLGALYAVIYKDTGVAGTSRLINLKQFLQLRTVINNSFTIEWGDKGVLQLK
jgi:hypothetical protein